LIQYNHQLYFGNQLEYLTIPLTAWKNRWVRALRSNLPGRCEPPTGRGTFLRPGLLFQALFDPDFICLKV